ncbi:protein yellow-like [Harmonia axyridis]|uniref:protein yellow-like n=1 Tax=Harmonia axyridis TaxID=115357 RepID=UPI001E2790AA|nr:protein yellow-like [Harmonia axyridis]
MRFVDFLTLILIFYNICLTSGIQYFGDDNFIPIFEWSQLEFEYDSAIERKHDIEDGFFVPGVPAIIDVDVYYSSNKTNRLFVTIPRFQYGSPATLGEVTFDIYRGNYIIRPYPSWSWHRNPTQCLWNRLISVYRIQIDECGRMWVLDTGRYGEHLICPPQILAFDLKTNKVIYRYEIPRDQYESRSIFVTPVVDVRESCQDVFVYAADCQTYAIIVYDVKRGESWQIIDKTMYPYPNFGTFDILGDSFDLMDGILGMALTPFVPGRDRKLFFHAMSSDTENWVYTSDLRKQKSTPEIFHVYRGKRSSQSAAEAMDRNGIMYFGLMSDVTFNCWDTSTEYGSPNIEVVDNNRTTMQFVSGVKVIKNMNGGQELFIVTSRFQKVATETITPTEINFRVLARRINKYLVERCRSSSSTSSGFHPVNVLGSSGGSYGLIPRPPKIGYRVK